VFRRSTYMQAPPDAVPPHGGSAKT
jgi:hypothetical protein